MYDTIDPGPLPSGARAGVSWVILVESVSTLDWVGFAIHIIYCEQIRVFKAGICGLYGSAWNNKIRLWSYFVGLRTKVMMERDSWGC